MIVYPNAKVNIGLRVLRKREDGFHELETVFYPAPITDILEIVPAAAAGPLAADAPLRWSADGKIGFALYGMHLEGDPMDNLCVRAARMLSDEFDLPPVAIYLHKRIPAGAGLGGGSSDAAFTLKCLNTLFEIGLDETALEARAATLGSDVPFFIRNRPMLGQGRGEILSPVEIPALDGYEIRLLLPPVFVSTSDAYRGIIPRDKWSAGAPQHGAEQHGAGAQPSSICAPMYGAGVRQVWGEATQTQIESGREIFFDTPLLSLLQHPVEEWRDFIVNDFERTVFEKFPQLVEWKERLYQQGAIYASMSGSGSAMFGIWEKI